MMSRLIVSSFCTGAPAASTASAPTYWINPSALWSSYEINPVASHFVNHSGISAYGWSVTVLSRFVLANTATAGAAVYRSAMNTSAQPTLIRASRTRGTV